ncbi:MAG TPA: Gfo/Idh/MocA family oxidoreductase [Spirochaetia bacterium]|nr:Gfo/Idh/MocA family oxidoreductase [Spirochaetia bacterium]
MEDLRIGVIGAGGRGSIAKHAHKPGGGSRVVACCDTVPEHLDQAREWYGSDIFTTADYRTLLEQELDAVFVTTPDFLHEEHTLAALEAGVAVYLEKPMAITIAGCDRILEAARARSVRLYLGHNMRHMSFVRKMKQLIDAGLIGEVKTAWCRHFVGNGGDFYFKDWHADRRLSTGLLLQKAAHDIDVLHWLCGAYATRVNAMGSLSVYGEITDRHDPEEPGNAKANHDNWPPLSQTQLNPVVDVEDVSMLQMQLENGVLASYQQCHFAPDYWRNYTIIGTEGRIENFGDGAEGTTIRLWNRRTNWNPGGDEVFPLDEETGGHGGADPKIVAEFVRFAREGGPIDTSPVAARYSVAVGVQATESLRSGGVPRDVPRLDAEVEEYFAGE